VQINAIGSFPMLVVALSHYEPMMTQEFVDRLTLTTNREFYFHGAFLLWKTPLSQIVFSTFYEAVQQSMTYGTRSPEKKVLGLKNRMEAIKHLITPAYIIWWTGFIGMVSALVILARQ
jgi:hypothetical protein